MPDLFLNFFSLSPFLFSNLTAYMAFYNGIIQVVQRQQWKMTEKRMFKIQVHK